MADTDQRMTPGAELRLSGGSVLIVGGSNRACAITEALRDCGAHPERIDEAALPPRGDPGSSAVRGFAEAYLDGRRLVVAASGDADLDEWFLRLAGDRGIPAASASDADAGSVRLGTALGDEAHRVTVTARHPAVVADLSLRTLAAVPARYHLVERWVSTHADAVEAAIGEPHARERFWDRLLSGQAAELILAGREEEAGEILRRSLESVADDGFGEVYLIGSGPGDPDLLTLRALRLLRRAEVVLYDRLVAPEIVALARADAERIYVGKQRDRHPVPQDRINELLVDHARRGRHVARLKGGDPFIFGRGGEEIESLMREGITFQVVPGITAASGCAAYAGIPLTHRDHAQSCVFVTGHRKADGGVALDFEGLVRPQQTVVFYMGLTGLQILCEGLIAHGMSPDTPAALIQQGTTPRQHVVVASLRDLPERATAAGVRAPTLVIVGGVVRLRERLAWFEPHATTLSPGG